MYKPSGEAKGQFRDWNPKSAAISSRLALKFSQLFLNQAKKAQELLDCHIGGERIWRQIHLSSMEKPRVNYGEGGAKWCEGQGS